MSTTTAKLGLFKPDLTDVADITKFNENWDKIDEEINNIPITSEVPSDAEMWIDPNDENEVITRESLNAAPAGYGLGGACIDVDSWDNAIETGWYRSSGNAHINGRTYGYVTKHADNWVIQEAFQIDDVSNVTQKATRAKIAGVWQPWEWVNPPMVLGVEYRTTERYKSEAVYAKRINCFAAPASVDISALGIDTLVRWSGFVTYYGVALPCSNASWKVDVNRTTISTTSAYEQASAHFYIILYYTKS